MEQLRRAIVRPIQVAGHRRDNQRALRFYRGFIGPGDVCFDVGANVGDRTETFRRLGANVVAVEPQPQLADGLRKRFAGKRSVSVEGVGLSDRSGAVEMHLNRDANTVATMASHWKTGRFADMHWEGVVCVPVQTLDDLIARYGLPEFCKLDVEGYESTVLGGLTQPLPAVSFEFTREFLEEVVTCLDRLEVLGPVVTNFSIGESMELYLDEWGSVDRVLAEIGSLTATEPDLWGDVYVKVRR